MLRRVTLAGEQGSALITALLVMVIMLPLGFALLSIVDTQASNSDKERTRDRAFNLADSALTSAAFNLSRYAWPSTGTLAPSNAGPTGAAGVCGTTSYGATLGAATNAGSATAKLQPNLNASYDDAAYTGATWQVNVCDDDPAGAGPTVWKDALLGRSNYDANNNQLMWVRSEASVNGHKRVLAALVRVAQTPALSSKYGVITGRMNAELTNTVGTVLNSGLVGGLLSSLLGSDPLVAPDTAHDTSPPTSGITAVRCGALDGCLTGALGAAGSLALVNSLVTSGDLVQSTAPTATSAAAIAQLKQQAINSGTYVATTAGASTYDASGAGVPPACTIPAAASASTVVYIDQVGDGDQYCLLSVASTKAYKALVIGKGRVVLRGNNTITAASTTSTVNTFRGVVYALNEQRTTLGDAALPSREVVRIDRGAHVVGGVAADGKSAQVGIYPPGLCTSLVIAGIDIGCLLSGILGNLNGYNPAIRSNVSLMNAVQIHAAASLVAGTYHDILGEAR